MARLMTKAMNQPVRNDDRGEGVVGENFERNLTWLLRWENKFSGRGQSEEPRVFVFFFFCEFSLRSGNYIKHDN